MDKNIRLMIALSCGALVACSGEHGPKATAATHAVSASAQPVAGLDGIEIKASNSIAIVPAYEKASSENPAQPRFKPVLDSERLVMEENSLSARAIAPLLKSKNFDKFLERLQAEAAQDPLAQDVSSAERKKIEAAFQGKGVVQAFACGLSVCAGSISLDTDSAAFEHFADDFLKNGPANTSLLNHRVDLGNRQFMERFVMSVDSSVQGVSMPKISPSVNSQQ